MAFLVLVAVAAAAQTDPADQLSFAAQIDWYLGVFGRQFMATIDEIEAESQESGSALRTSRRPSRRS